MNLRKRKRNEALGDDEKICQSTVRRVTRTDAMLKFLEREVKTKVIGVEKHCRGQGSFFRDRISNNKERMIVYLQNHSISKQSESPFM